MMKGVGIQLSEAFVHRDHEVAPAMRAQIERVNYLVRVGATSEYSFTG